MKYPYIDTLPPFLKPSVPSMYTGESMTVLEYLSKIRGKLVEVIEEFNSFVADITNICEEYKDNYAERQDLFERVMEQRFSDFVNTIKLKYASQDKVIANAIQMMVDNLPDTLGNVINQMYGNGEFDVIVYNSIENLKREFDAIVTNTNNFQNSINKSFATLTGDMELFKSQTTSDFEALETELRELFNNLVLDSNSADMQKAVYDTNNSGVVDDAEKLGGQLPSYYAKKQELETANSSIETLYNTLNAINTLIETVQNVANTAKTKAENSETKADSALTKAESGISLANQAQTTADNALSVANSAIPYAFTAKGTSGISITLDNGEKKQVPLTQYVGKPNAHFVINSDGAVRINITGVYMISAGVYISTNSDSDDESASCDCFVHKVSNGVEEEILSASDVTRSKSGASNGHSRPTTGSHCFSFNSGDTIKLYARTNNQTGSASAGNNATYLTVMRVS